VQKMAKSVEKQELGPLEGTLILGSAARAQRLFDEFSRNDRLSHVHLADYPELGQLSDRGQVSRIVLADPGSESRADLAEALIDFKFRGVKIETAVDSFERLSRKIWLEGLSPEWLILANGFRQSRLYLAGKRVCDIVLSLLLLVITFPIAVMVAVAIKLESPGPVIFKQERVGFRGRNFILYKFRSMRTDAEKDGPAWAQDNDSRVTRVGAFIRKARLDEIPQVFNVLRGDMSFIGPRPERPYFVDLLKSKIRFYELRHYVKPGITGWAQVMYRYGASVEDSYQKLQYDLYYAKNVSLGLDLLILLKTIKVVLAGEGR
jgi:sugar transferase (PEP-CTERM system associated)